MKPIVYALVCSLFVATSFAETVTDNVAAQMPNIWHYAADVETRMTGYGEQKIQELQKQAINLQSDVEHKRDIAEANITDINLRLAYDAQTPIDFAGELPGAAPAIAIAMGFVEKFNLEAQGDSEKYALQASGDIAFFRAEIAADLLTHAQGLKTSISHQAAVANDKVAMAQEKYADDPLRRDREIIRAYEVFKRNVDGVEENMKGEVAEAQRSFENRSRAVMTNYEREMEEVAMQFERKGGLEIKKLTRTIERLVARHN